MSSRDVWSHGGMRSDLKDLLSSAFALLLLAEQKDDPVYFASPWITEVALFDNSFRQSAALFPEVSDKRHILFSDYLTRLSATRDIRIITRKDKYSEDFIMQKNLAKNPRVQIRFSDQDYHEKGILTPFFYIFGSMNITRSGVEINGEKITYYSLGTKEGKEKIGRTYVEFNNLWLTLKA